MQILNITAQNFMALRHVDIDLSECPVHLFCGKNEQGKSSLQEAVRFALLGETDRVSLKKHYDQMVTDGAKNGTVSVTLVPDHGDAAVTTARSVKDGKALDGSAFLELPMLPHVLDAHRFSQLDDKARRIFLTGLMKMKITGEVVKSKLMQRRLNEEKVDTLLPFLRTGGFELTASEAKQHVSDDKALWKTITGEAYGSNKADTWKADKPFFMQTAYDESVKVLEEHRAEYEALLQKRGQVTQTNEQHAFSKDDIDQLKQLASGFAESAEAVKHCEESVHQQRQKVVAAQAKIDNAITAVECPCCQAMLIYQQGELVTVGKTQPVTDAGMKKLNNALAKQETALTSTEEDLSRANAALRAADVAAQTLSRLSDVSLHAEPPSISIEEIDEQLAALKSKGEIAKAAVDDMEKARIAIESADDRTKTAKELHAGIVEWQAIADALAPDGVPSEMLASALAPINNRLRETAEITGWPQVMIDNDMQVTANTRLYSMHSESAKWRIDAALTDAIAHLSGLKLLVLDRVDVNDIGNRLALIKWANKIKSDYDTMILLGTFKEVPQGLPAGFCAHWLENGEIAQQQRAA